MGVVVFQVVHGFTPADTDAEGVVGLIGGLVLLVAAIAAVVGIRTRKPWARSLTGWTGLVVAVGFVLYHAVPFHSAVTNPYISEPVGAPAWISVALAVASGAWAAVEGLGRQPAATGLAPRG